jgi:hypothetical protein
VSRRYNAALSWLHTYLQTREPHPVLRELTWREWAQGNAERVLADMQDGGAGGPGRPASISDEVDKLVLQLHASGLTQREIAARLNTRFPRATDWTRSSVRSVLKRYSAPQRPRGPKPSKGRYSPGDVTRTDYREVEFGESLYDPDGLRARNPRRS